MPYSELIKNFSKIREYMRQFYVYGFKSRNEFTIKSLRSYDNERRRIESWLSDYMCFRQQEDGKIVFMSIDSRTTDKNPLYTAFKTKSFTNNDIIFHFYILDLLSSQEEYSIGEILDAFYEKYLYNFSTDIIFDESSVRKKLKEYVKIGIIKERKRGKELLYSAEKDVVDLTGINDVLCFFSEANPLGVIGSFILDKCDSTNQFFRFKHHYIFHAIDSGILYEIVCAIREGCQLSVKTNNRKTGKDEVLNAFPVKVYISTQSGRQYLLCCKKEDEKMLFIRLDNIVSVQALEVERETEKYFKNYADLKKHLWGVSLKEADHTDTLSMIIFVDENEEYIVKRLYREKRCGGIEKIDSNHYRFTAQLFDAREILPWVRTFIGRIEKFECSDKAVQEKFYDDIRNLYELYGGED